MLKQFRGCGDGKDLATGLSISSNVLDRAAPKLAKVDTILEDMEDSSKKHTRSATHEQAVLM